MAFAMLCNGVCSHPVVLLFEENKEKKVWLNRYSHWCALDANLFNKLRIPPKVVPNPERVSVRSVSRIKKAVFTGLLPSSQAGIFNRYPAP